jgi:hypothetical protein
MQSETPKLEPKAFHLKPITQILLKIEQSLGDKLKWLAVPQNIFALQQYN